MEYRSYVTSLTFDLPQTSTLAEDTRIKVHEIAGKPSPHFSFISLGGPIAQAGHIQFLGETMNPNVKVGPAKYFGSGGATSLDNMDISHVVYFGTEIHYSGELVHLEDVVFVNCTFVFDNGNRSRMLAENILTSEIINFTAS